MGPFPHNAPPALISPENPAGTDGFEFVEFAHREPQKLRDLFKRMGYSEVAKHRTKAIEVWRQGDITYLLNAEPDSHAMRFVDAHGPCAPSMAWRVVNAKHAFNHAVAKGAKLETGGARIGNQGFFFQPTVLTDVPLTAELMNEEPFGPIAMINRFDSLDEALTEANRLPYGLSAYAYTTSLASANRIYNGMESGAISINHHHVALPEQPFGGIKDSGYGVEGGPSALEAFMVAKFVSISSLV